MRMGVVSEVFCSKRAATLRRRSDHARTGGGGGGGGFGDGIESQSEAQGPPKMAFSARIGPLIVGGPNENETRYGSF